MITLIMFVIKFPFQPLDIITAFLIAIVEEGYWAIVYHFFNYILNSSAFFYIKSVDYQGIFDTINNLFPSGYINLNIY